MGKFMLGRKAGMTQIFDEQGHAIPVTVIACGPLTVLHSKTDETDGYRAVCVGYEAKKKVNRPIRGQFEKIGVEPMRVIREFRTDDEYSDGQVLSVDQMFSVGDAVDIAGTSKGKGYQGGIRRHGMHRGPEAHGSKYHRKAGPMSSSSTPSKVPKGNKMPGHLGSERVTVQNLRVVQVDGERHFLVVKGAVPGANGGLLEIRSTVKGSK